MVSAPIIAIVGQVFAIYLLFKNIDVLAGTIGYVDLIGPFAVIGVVIGLGRVRAQGRQPQEVRHDRPMIDEGDTVPTGAAHRLHLGAP